MATLRDILFLVRSEYVVIFRNGYDEKEMTKNEAFKEYHALLNNSVNGLEIADNKTIRILL